MTKAMNKEQATEWARDTCENGTGWVRYAYLEKFPVGEIPKDHWDDPLFDLGIEYGLLIAVAKIYGDLGEKDTSI